MNGYYELVVKQLRAYGFLTCYARLVGLTKSGLTASVT